MGESWERDFEAGEHKTSEAGAKKAYAILVPDQGCKINCFIFPFLQSSLHLCSLRHFLHSTIPFQNKPSLPRIITNIRRNQTEILEGHSETLLALPVRLPVLSDLWEAAVSIESGIRPANTSAIEGTTRRLGGRAGRAGVSIGHLVFNLQCW